MIGPTPLETDLAVQRGGHPAAFGLALAELSLFWDNHTCGAPEMHEPRLNIRAAALAEVQAVADWLGVEVHERYGTHHAQKRFGTGEDSIWIEAHYTPDQDRAHALRTEAAGRARQDPRELAKAAA